MNFMGTDKALILAHTFMDHVTLSDDVNVMLTPEFYTLKKEALPIQYSYQAKKIAPSLFEGLLEREGSYDYMVWKEEEEWVFLAYDMKMITVFLESKGFVLEHISKLFFAQQSVALFDKPVFIGEHAALIALDNTVVLVPSIALGDEEGSAEFDDHFTPKKGIGIERNHGTLLTVKQTSVLAVALSLFAMMFFVEGARYSNSINAGESQMETLLESYPELRSSYTRESIVSKYKTLDTHERKKRDLVKTVSKMIFEGVTLTTFDMDEKKFSASFTCKDTKVVQRLQALAKKNKLNASSLGSSNVKIEGVL